MIKWLPTIVKSFIEQGQRDRKFRALVATGGYGPDSDYWYYPVSRPAINGVEISEYNALQIADVYKCVRVISETIASLPLFIYRRLKNGGKERAIDHPLYDFLHIAPNPEMTTFQWREAGIAHLLTWGNWYSEIDRDGFGNVHGIWPLRPDRMEIKRGDDPSLPDKVRGISNGLIYQYRPTDGSEVKYFPQEDILHIPGLGFNGVIGYSVIAMMREGMSLGKAAEEFSSRFFANDATPPIAIKHPGHLTDAGQTNLRKSWVEAHGGIKKAGTPAILEENMSIEKIGIPMKDAQFLELREFQRAEIAGMYRIPPHMIGDLRFATFSNIEEQGLNFVTNTLGAWLARIEQGMCVKLFSEKERKKYFPEHLVEGLLRGNIETRFNSYMVARQNGWVNADEIRERENMNPLDNDRGKTYWMPLNFQEIDTSKSKEEEDRERQEKIKEQQPEPEPEPEEEMPEKQMPMKQEKKDHVFLAFRRLFEAEISRILRRESISIKRALKKPDYQAYLACVEECYRELPLFCSQNLYPVLKSYSELNGNNDVTDCLKTFIESHVTESRNQIEKWNGVYIQEKEFVANSQAIEEILDNWLVDRPSVASQAFYEISGKKEEKKKELSCKLPDILVNLDEPKPVISVNSLSTAIIAQRYKAGIEMSVATS